MVGVCEECDSKGDRSEDRLKVGRLKGLKVFAEGEKGGARFGVNPTSWTKERG